MVKSDLSRQPNPDTDKMKSKKPVTVDAARIRMADLCARSEQCEHDIRQKLFKMGLPSSQSNEVISYLTDNRFLDNSRFARSFARDKCRFSGWGKYKIRMALAAKRISSADISEGLDAIETDDYSDALRRTASAKARTLDLFGEDARENRMKLYRHILSRGFEPQLASDMVKTILKESAT